MFINCSNHSSENWDQDQRQEAEKWGKIVDFPFPNVSADYDEQQVAVLVEKTVKRIMELKPDVVMCQGEFTVTYGIVERLKKMGIPSVAACSERQAIEKRQDDGSVLKTSQFRFVRFRKF